MNNAKVTVTKEVAEAIESAKSIRSEEVIVSMSISKSFVGEQAVLNDVNPFTIAKILINGYTIEKSPEEKVREYYDTCRSNWHTADEIGDLGQAEYLNGQSSGVSIALDILGIKIEGVNA